MIHKKPALLLSSYSGLNGFYTTPPSRPTTSCRWTSCEQRQQLQQPHHAFATVAGSQEQPQDEKHEWPSPTQGQALPTPYQILGVKPSAQYSKHHFYKLVKLYHPDRTSEAHIHSSICHLPPHVILERYRLIVTAHTILSDPGRRRQYDRYGIGWGAKAHQDYPGFGFPSAAAAAAERPSWKAGEDPMNNATWEDWEKWYRRNDEDPQGPRYMSHTAFLSLIVMFAAVGGVGQATRANFMSQNFLEQRNSLNDRIHADLVKERDAAKKSTRNERIERFLERQDPAVYADPQLRKMVLTPDVCDSGHVEEGKGTYSERRR